MSVEFVLSSGAFSTDTLMARSLFSESASSIALSGSIPTFNT
ncbi:uncharacterized protein METZ01_LOCUS315353 [marine metagenome]|uniref:Uncharacterized protein n=1 Tax=marine metagenome TaxID=408172 RepID=A0A382NMR1_9ZZZZ